ncbi:hypothetical protein [Haloferax sp. Atlit-47N]|uniref:hypothetical protein n=1 Tax=Haloferax sp. Atlit-47N TaxID=2077199 RepID=UPI0013148744|nr:hypothetical protein [Haloferax sp. Atlit-47N]
MSDGERLTADSLTLVPDADGERLQSVFSALLQENGVIEQESEEYRIAEQAVFNDIGQLGLFSFYYDGWSDQGELSYVILDEDLIASIWSTDDSVTPYGRGKVRYPLKYLGHAFGNCGVCPAKSFLGFNAGQSNLEFSFEEGIEGIKVPNTAEYAEKASGEACDTCQEYMSSWFSEKVRDNPDYLWALGGSGLLHRIPTDYTYTFPDEFEDYDVLELATGSDPPSEIETDDNFIAGHEGRMDSLGLDNEGEFLFNAVIAFQLHVDFDFDEIKLNCRCEGPVEMSQELDIVLSDFENQQIVVIETTAENEVSSSKLRNKHNVILQFHALQNRYEELDILYLYLTTGSYPEDLHEDSATLDAQENLTELGISVDVVSRPDDVSQTDLDPNALNHHGSKEFIENFDSLYESLLSECSKKVERFMK